MFLVLGFWFWNLVFTEPEPYFGKDKKLHFVILQNWFILALYSFYGFY